MDYAGQTKSQILGRAQDAQKAAYHAGNATVSPERAIDGVKGLIRELAGQVSENTRRAEQIAARLGWCSPKADSAAQVPPSNGHMDELARMINEIKFCAAEAVDYLNAIERQV
jgi:hypothetical protein